MAYVKEPFSELDVMNNFMFNKLTTEPATSEKFCRLMLRSLIGKEVGKISINSERIVFPDDPNKRGVRLDVEIDEYHGETITTIYDIEPHRDREDAYPKKNRYIQAQLDKNNMESGKRNFKDMPELYIMCITNYDPFGHDYMVYTIKNQCVEVPELVYNDGVKIYYFNTSGTKGGSKELKAFLKYLEESTKDNATDSATKEADECVDMIKDLRRVEGDYMTVGDWVDSIVREAVEEALEEKDKAIEEKDKAIEAKDKAIEAKNAKIAELEAKLSAAGIK